VTHPTQPFDFIHLLPEPWLVVDPHGTVIHANPNAQMLAKAKDVPLPGQPLHKGFNLEHMDTGQPLDDFKHCLPAGGPPLPASTHPPFLLTTHDQRTLHVGLTLVGARNLPPTKDQPHWLVRIDDHTERQQRNKERLAMRTALRMAQRMETMGRLTSGIAHDFNNLLSVINSYSDLMLMKMEDDSPLRPYAEQIRSAGYRGADLICKLMLFSRREAREAKVIDAPTVIREVLQLVRALIPEDIEIKQEEKQEQAPVLIDPGQLEQVLVNLCVNARDAMPNGGTLSVNSSIVNDAPRPMLCITVADNGCGMDTTVINHIFEPFYTTKSPNKGTGLGLSTVKEIIETNHGYIEVQSKPGQGSTFTIFLPCATRTADAAPKATTSTPGDQAIKAHGETVLVVEDNTSFLYCLERALTAQGYAVQTASDGNEAMVKYLKRIHEFDLLITDLILPGAHGNQIATEFRRQNPELRVIYLTGQAEQLREPPHEHTRILNKPCPLLTLLQTSRELLEA
jgi:two-component system cell cycle sensor histidine kinase/response regulator CckA